MLMLWLSLTLICGIGCVVVVAVVVVVVVIVVVLVGGGQLVGWLPCVVREYACVSMRA